MTRARSGITIETATTPEAFEIGRGLICEYADWLGVDLCFQGYEEELANLDTVYGLPAGRLFLALEEEKAAGCIGLRSLAEPGVAEMKAAGLLGLDIPAGFQVPDPSQATPDEDPLDLEDTPEFAQDFVGPQE